jgi:hypothetical protein
MKILIYIHKKYEKSEEEYEIKMKNMETGFGIYILLLVFCNNFKHNGKIIELNFNIESV